MIIKKKVILAACIFISILEARSQEYIRLWPEGKKINFNGKKVTDSLFNERIWRVSDPGMYSFLVPQGENKGTAVLICPGGGYERLSYLYNGFNLAKWYNSIGINAFVLIYRLPHQADLTEREKAPLQDAQRAMKIIRANAARWNIKPGKLGIMGTSAGGHLATMAGTKLIDISSINDSLDKYDHRPDFMVLLSPVITMGEYAHKPSRQRLLGPDTSQVMLDLYSNEKQVSNSTPPVFMVHALNDSTVPVQNSLLFYQALIAHKVNASLHIFPQGGHNIRIDDNPGSTDQWLVLLEAWLKEMGFAEPLPFKK
ncbi:MAG: alpha/beta hydrolase [Chitinophagaceae bacterium]|nr:alpha/beta hydrolase [Chitinophagaceae bacterium]